jgi:glycosyltransferase involved in cell wall biosynthesis
MQQSLSPLLSVVIPTYNRMRLLSLCLSQLLSQQKHPYECYEIIVVDDGSTDGTPDHLSQLTASQPAISYIQQANAGHAVARRTGFLKARGEIVVSLDDDCIPTTGWINEIIQVFKQHPDIALVCGKIENPTDTHVAWAQYFIDHSLWIGTRMKKNIRILPTANTAYRREVLGKGTLYDDGKKLGYRDIIYNYDITGKGYKAMYNPRMCVRHMRWDQTMCPIENGDTVFIQGQIRHGNGFREGGYRIYGNVGKLFLKAPRICWLVVKALLIGRRALRAGMLAQYIRSLRCIVRGLLVQATAIKNRTATQSTAAVSDKTGRITT